LLLEALCPIIDGFWSDEMTDSQDPQRPPELVSLETDHPIWDRFFTIAPLVVVGTREQDGRYDLAPKHMVTPMGWENYFGFVCTPEHATYQNILREEVFTVSFPTADSVVLTSLSAAPRCDDASKPSLAALPTFPAQLIDGRFMRDASLFFECRLDRIIDGFGINCLITGKIIAAHLVPEALRSVEMDDQDTIAASPLVAYVSPGRFAKIDRSMSFPFPKGFQRTKDSAS
jgi:flavin reductase (DIM6/NTAB) family NADH-FMN oxidoreductase RutF